MTKGLLTYPVLACLALASTIQAAQVDDFNLSLTRSEADQRLTKDYNFTILEDTTVRRQWHTAGRRIAMDFDITNEEAICIRITYDTPVARAEAEQDVAKITGGQADSKGWNTTKKGAGEKVGITGKSQVQKLEDGSIIFWEWSNKKCTRITYFAKSPKANRWALKEMPTTSNKSLLGSTSTTPTGVAKSLIADEQRRKNITPTPAVAVAKPEPKPEVKPEPKPETPVAVVTPPKPATPATPATPAKRPAAPATPAKPAPAPAQAPEQEEVVVTQEYSGTWGFWHNVWEDFQNVKDEAGRTDWVVAFREKGTPSLLGVMGGALLIVLLIIWTIVAKIRAKARARANYEKILNKTPKDSAPKVARKSAAPAPEEAPVKDAPAKDAPAKEAPAKEAPAKDAPAKDAPASK